MTHLATPPLLAVCALGLFSLAGLGPTHAQILTDVSPDGNANEPRYGGRAAGLTVHPYNRDIVYVATEAGGFFVSRDGGTHWSHIDALPSRLGVDILIDPQDPSVIIASGIKDYPPKEGGIWRSDDGGVTWSKPATTNPACASLSAFGIAIPDHPGFHQNVYAATDCGISISSDSGSTWTYVDPCPDPCTAAPGFPAQPPGYYDVTARVVGGQVQLDVCGDEGYFRSPDGGATWSSRDFTSPSWWVKNSQFNPCGVATAPQDPDIVYLANFGGLEPTSLLCQSRLMENARGGEPGHWVDMHVSSTNCRPPWVVTHPDGGTRYQVYFGDSVRLRVQTCLIPSFPHCKPGWLHWLPGGLGAHGDFSDIEFDPSTPNGCPIVLSDDGGVFTSSDCGQTWQDGNRGLHALEVVAFAGTLRGGGVTNLYAGTQDNGIYVSRDSAASWTRPSDGDVYNLLADRTSPARVFFRKCGDCKNFIGDPAIVGSWHFNDPPGVVPTFAIVTQFGPRRYAMLTHNDVDEPNWEWTAWATADEGASWQQLGPSPLPAGPTVSGDIKASGPASSPTFYLRLGDLIYRLSGALDSTATLTPAHTGLAMAGFEWDVDPSDPSRLYAADFNQGLMMFSIDGGRSWHPDLELSHLVRVDGGFAPSGVAFDPFGDKIIVATWTAGLVVSVNNGQAWSQLAGSEELTNVRGFFFDPDNDVVWAGSRGRGIWRIALPDAQIQVPGDLSMGEACVGGGPVIGVFRSLRSVATLNICNTGTDDLVVDPITSSSLRFSVTEPSSGYPVTISPDFCFPFQVTFAPVDEGRQSATLAVPSNDPETPTTEVVVVGTGTVPDIRVTGSTDFGVTSNWQPGEKTVAACNTGSCDLSVASAAVSCTDFALVNNPFPAEVSPDSCLELVVRFTPTLPGPKTCDLTLTSDDPDSPVVTRTLTAETPPAISFHAELVDPHGALDTVAKQGSAYSLAYVHPFKPKLAWDARLASSSFDGRTAFDDTELWTVGANIRFTFNPASPARFFLNGGLGLYHFDPGDFEGGGNLGLGLTVPVGARFAFEVTYNDHLAFTASPDLEYGQTQLGFLVSF